MAMNMMKLNAWSVAGRFAVSENGEPPKECEFEEILLMAEIRLTTWDV